MKALGALALLLALVACGGDADGGTDGGSGDDASDPPASTGTPDTTDEPGRGEVDLASTEVCDVVRQGIDAFNLGDLDGTIERFEAAVPLAESLADDEPSDDTDLLLRAVRYYAGLAADDYVEASQTSPEFLLYKEFTLTRCAYEGPPTEATDPAVPA